jgi:Domain of unknown function (DUF4157)
MAMVFASATRADRTVGRKSDASASRPTASMARLPAWSRLSSASPPAGLFVERSAALIDIPAHPRSVSKATDASEIEARRFADSPVSSSQPALSSTGAPRPLKPGAIAPRLGNVAPIVNDVLAAPGRPLDRAARANFEARLATDLEPVRIHTDVQAARSAAALRANAYTVGHHIVFGADRYQPASHAGRRLLAHEIAHVLQKADSHDAVVHRDCADPDFCKPYATKADAASAEWWLRHTYLPLEGIPTFGTEAGSLWESFLSRVPGDSLAPVVFNDAGSYLVSSFRDSWDTKDDMDAVIDLVGARLNRAPGPPLRDNAPATMSLANFLSTSEMENRPINYSNPLSVAGHIAGGIGNSDAGPDYRKITYANVVLEKTTLFGSTGYISVKLIPHYEVFDAIDFCPGDCGSPLEQLVTIPMSRLEASSEAYDVPFKVVFSPDFRSKRFWF